MSKIEPTEKEKLFYWDALLRAPWNESPKFKKQMAAHRRREAAYKRAGKSEIAKARALAAKSPGKFLPMEACPFKWLDNSYGLDGVILVADGKNRTLAEVRKRFGTPFEYEEEPTYSFQDGFMVAHGGKIKKRDKPAWWYKYEFKDALTDNGEYGKDEIDFVPTKWIFLPGDSK
jgi:hypothetical protein